MDEQQVPNMRSVARLGNPPRKPRTEDEAAAKVPSILMLDAEREHDLAFSTALIHIVFRYKDSSGCVNLVYYHLCSFSEFFV